MLKRKIVVVLYIALISFFCVYLFFKIQERDLIIQLNNNNLSLDAYKITLKQDISLAELDQKIKDNDKLTDVQLHYQAKDQRNVTYFYGKGNYTQPPLLSGHFFSSADFESDVPLAVVGKNYEKKDCFGSSCSGSCSRSIGWLRFQGRRRGDDYGCRYGSAAFGNIGGCKTDSG